MTQMQITQSTGGLPNIGSSAVKQRTSKSGGKSFFALMSECGSPEGSKADTALPDAELCSLAAPAALFIPGLIPQIPVQEGSPEASEAAQTVLSVLDAPVLPMTADETGHILPEPVQDGTEASPNAERTPQTAPAEGTPVQEAAQSQTSPLPAFKLVLNPADAPKSDDAMAEEMVKPAPEAPLSPIMTGARTPKGTQPAENTKAQLTQAQSGEPLSQLAQEPTKAISQREANTSTSPEHEQTGDEHTLAPPLSLSSFMLKRSEAVNAPAKELTLPVQEPALQLAEEVKIFAQEGSGQYVVELTPHELGRVTIQLEITDGSLTLSFKADHPATQSLLMAGTGELKAALENAMARPVNLANPAPQNDSGFKGQEAFKDRQNPREEAGQARKHKPREAFAGVIGRIKAG